MARLNKFASVNLNDSYGKPDRGGSASSGNNGTSSGSGKPRISSPGGMLVLSRPGRTQPPSPKPGQARLGIPSPVNLPSLKRETSAGDSCLAGSPPIVGWTKGESPPLQTGWTKAGESPTDMSPLHQKAALSRSLDTAGESLKVISTGKPDVYAPPAMRAAALQTGSTSRVLPPTSPLLIEKPLAIIRGEEFPTLQAAVARPPTPPQHPRQKDLQQKQREKQQDAKEQHLKLQQLSQSQGHKQVQVDSLPSSDGNLQSQPPTLSLRPLGKSESTYQKVNVGGTGPDHTTLPSQYGGLNSNANPDGSPSWSSPAGVSAQSSANNKGSNALRLPPTGGMPSHGNVSKVDDAKESGHSFRPQYRSPLPASQSSSSIEARQSGFQANSESTWLASSRRDSVSAPRDINHPKYSGDIHTNNGEEAGRIDSEMRNALYAKENYFSRDSSSYREGSSTSGITRGDAYMEQGVLARDSSDVRVFGRSSSLVHDGVPRIEGFHSQRSFVKEVYNRDSREGNTRVYRESSSKDNGDSYSRDVRDNREIFFRDSGDTYELDVKEAYNRDYRNVYTRDVKEVYSQDPAISKQVGYGYASSNNGDNSWRGHSSHADPPYVRGVASPAGISPSHNPGSVYDSHYGKQYGSPGMGDQFFSREARSGNDLKAPRSLHTELYSSNPEMFGSRRVRSPALSSSSFDPIKEVHEVHSDRPQRIYEEDRQAKYEDKVMDVKVAGSELHGSSLAAQSPAIKRESTSGFGTRAFPTSINRKLDDERSTREDTKKQLEFEDERRKEAAKQKLMELEERIARRAAEARKEEVEEKGKEASVEPVGLKQEDVEQIPSDAQYELEGMAPVPDRDGDITWGEEDSGSKLARPSSALSVSSWTYKTPGEGATSYPEVESRLVGESELNQDRKMMRPRSPSSWRKEVGGGPTSKLFSSPYIESGGFRRPSDGGTYKLF
ncbi:hypothetical protein GOP47_0014012 [Adiantum capillus-veneris]|uniref:Uncharacterized protein n=1 Tax=Adiantum capillus-veneris TaxID=13818 RepID=A0A9D4UQB2_ADICA|nr:hypothetical protein GOP47_0014012 [Adiantum capillus-veneris]